DRPDEAPPRGLDRGAQRNLSGGASKPGRTTPAPARCRISREHGPDRPPAAPEFPGRPARLAGTPQADLAGRLLQPGREPHKEPAAPRGASAASRRKSG